MAIGSALWAMREHARRQIEPKGRPAATMAYKLTQRRARRHLPAAPNVCDSRLTAAGSRGLADPR